MESPLALVESRAIAAPVRPYALYGLPVLSELALPVRPVPVRDVSSPAWVFKRAPAGQAASRVDGPLIAEACCHGPCHGGAAYSRLYRGPGGAWLWTASIGTCHVTPDARRVDVFAEPTADPRALGLVLVGHVSTFVLQQLGFPSLHASAIVADGGAIVFLGRNGQGKSSLAAHFVGRGGVLLTDDVLPLEAPAGGPIHGRPGLPMMKLWPAAAAHTVARAESLPHLVPNWDKRLFVLDHRHAFARVPARIRAVYVLDRYDPSSTGRQDIDIRGMSRREAVAALLAFTSHGEYLLPEEGPRLLNTYARLSAQAPVRVLSFPSGFEHQAAVSARIRADLVAV